jgi:hypothetical protein
MKTTLTQPRCFEFAFPHLDTLVQVEDHGNSVEIRATRDTFSEQRKMAFLHELAAEGFIDDSHQWTSLRGSDFGQGVHWRVDRSWLGLTRKVASRTRRIYTLLLVSSGFALWTVLTVFLYFSTRR